MGTTVVNGWGVGDHSSALKLTSQSQKYRRLRAFRHPGAVKTYPEWGKLSP